MADIANIKSELHWVAIDVARYWNAVLIETADGQRHRFKMANTAVDFDRLIAFIKGLGGNCRAAMEPTGDYHRALAYRLLSAGVEVVTTGVASRGQPGFPRPVNRGCANFLSGKPLTPSTRDTGADQ